MSRSSARKKRRRPQRQGHAGAHPVGQATAPDKRERQQEARRVRQQARTRARLRRTVGRSLAVAAVIGVAGLVFAQLIRVSGAKPIPETALEAASAAGCGDVQTPESDPARTHLSSGQTFTYSHEPATAGPHDPAPLPSDPHVYTSPVPETNAVHNLEHAYVLIYYRAEGPDALDAEVVQTLATFATGQDKVIMAPHTDLPAGTALALAAWDKLWECPASVTPQQATTIASGFVEAYRGTGNAPEPQAP